MATTINDIAKKVGVTKQTVSAVFNNKNTTVRISEVTRKKIMEAARELQYKPNYFAKSLKDKKTNCIGLMGGLQTINFSQHYFTDQIHGIEKELARDNSRYSLVVFGANFKETYDKSIQLVEKGMVDGLVLIILAEDLVRFEKELLPILIRNNLPFVVIHSLSRELPYNNVGFNTRRCGRLAGDYLASLDYYDIAYVTHKKESPFTDEVVAGLQESLEEGPKPDARIRHLTYEVKTSLDHYSQGRELGRNTVQLPRALFFMEDDAAFGFKAGLAERGVRVPEDVAILSHTDGMQAPQRAAGLSAVYHPLEEHGGAAVSMLRDILDGKLDKGKVHQRIVEPRLFKGNTCEAQ